MTTRIYWQHVESGCCGYVESERMAELLANNVCDTHISEELFNTRVSQGHEVVEPKSVWLVPEEIRKECFVRLSNLEFNLAEIKAFYQNEGSCFMAHKEDMKKHISQINRELEDILVSSYNECEEFK